ncbi:MAG: phosphotransferase [Rhodospirillaceae bacterium]
MIEVVQTLWRAAGGPAGAIVLRSCGVSGNNRVYLATGPNGEQVIAKAYFRHRPGERDRLAAEWDFLNHALRAGVACVPRPIRRDDAARLALYEFIEGRPLSAAEIGPDQVAAAAAFIAALNAAGPDARDPGTALPEAAEAAFSLADHCAVVDRRLVRLAEARMSGDAEALRLLEKIQAFWARTKGAVLAGASALGLEPEQPIPPGERLISPSDFGFHNALLRPDGDLAFIDFEYAGWDDVAKLVCDFFLQPAVPVEPALREHFLPPVLARAEDPGRARARIGLLRPMFGVKWCCIMLNRFLPERNERARFADPDHDPASRQRAQLDKTRNALQKLVMDPWLT